MEFAIEDGRLVAAKAGPIAEEIAALRGLLGRGGNTDEVIEEMRGPALLP